MPDLSPSMSSSPLSRRLHAVFADPAYKPPTPPAVAMEVLALARAGEVNVNAAATLFAKDPMLMARVLKVARSPLYGAVQIPTIKDAIVRLGARRLSHIVLEAALEMRVFRSDAFGPWMERARRHAVAVGHIASHIAWVGGVEPEQALIAGLMHDIGIPIALSAVADRKDLFPDLDDVSFQAALSAIHVEVGGMVAEEWQLAAEVTRVIHEHHHVEERRVEGARESAMLAVVVLADGFANDAGLAAGDVDVCHEDDSAWARQALEIDDRRIAQLAEELAPLVPLL